MRRTRSVGVILLLGLGAFAAPVQGQDAGGGSPPSVRERGTRLSQNYPNPFNPTTTIPFELFPEDFDGGRQAVVTIRIYNVLQQLVAVPTALNHPDRSGALVDGLKYPAPGAYEAYWNGTDRTGRKVASGIYYMQLIVNGQSELRKMIVAK